MSKARARPESPGDGASGRTASPQTRGNREAVVLRYGQQTAAAELGLRAIEGVPLDDLYASATELVREAMHADYVYVVQLRDREIVVRAHVGRTDMDPVGRVLDAKDSIADFVIRTGEPVFTPNFDTEQRFTPPPAVREASARSAAAVPVYSRSGPFGALIVMNRAVHQFQ